MDVDLPLTTIAPPSFFARHSLSRLIPALNMSDHASSGEVLLILPSFDLNFVKLTSATLHLPAASH